jgi:hypothetical protein
MLRVSSVADYWLDLVKVLERYKERGDKRLLTP